MKEAIVYHISTKYTMVDKFLHLQNTLQPDDIPELSIDDDNRKPRKSDKLTVGGRFSY